MVSYEISMGIGLINVCLCVGTLNLTEIVIAQLDIWLIFPLFPVGIMFLNYVNKKYFFCHCSSMNKEYLIHIIYTNQFQVKMV